jgi:hypothetical protein
MRKLLVSPDNSYGLVEPGEKDTVVEIGLFDVERISKIGDFCQHIESLGAEFDYTSVRIGYFEVGDNNENKLKFLAMQPKNLKGSAWVVLAPRTEVDV